MISILFFGHNLYVDSSETIIKVISALFILSSFLLYWIKLKWIYLLSAILIYSIDYLASPPYGNGFVYLELIFILGLMLLNESISQKPTKINDLDHNYRLKQINITLVFLISLEAFLIVFFNDLFGAYVLDLDYISDTLLFFICSIQMFLIILLFFWGYHLKFWIFLLVIFLARFSLELNLFSLTIHILLLFFMFDGKWFKAKKEAYGIIFFDGVCVLCNAFVDFILEYDKLGTFRFCSLQNSKAITYIDEKLLTDFNSVVLYTEEGTYSQSDASIKIITALGGGFVWFKILWIIPRPLRNFVYSIVARFRYLIFGKRTCRVPSEKDQERIIA